MASIEGSNDSAAVEAQASASFDDPVSGETTTVSSEVSSVPVETPAPESTPVSSVNEAIEPATPNFVAPPSDAPTLPAATEPAMQFAEPSAEQVASGSVSTSTSTSTSTVGVQATDPSPTPPATAPATAAENADATVAPNIAPTTSEPKISLAPLPEGIAPLGGLAAPTAPKVTPDLANPSAGSSAATDSLFPALNIDPTSPPTFSTTALPEGSGFTLPAATDPAMQFAETLNVVGAGGGQDIRTVALPSIIAQVSGTDAKTGETFNEATILNPKGAASSVPVVARAEGEPGRTASTEELLTAYANGAVQPKDITLQEQANLLGRGIPAAELGISPEQAAALPAVSDPGASELSPTSLALQEQTRRTTDPGALMAGNDAAAGTALDPATTIASASLNQKGLVDLGGGSTPGANSVALAGDPTGADVSGNLSDEVRQQLYTRIKSNDPEVTNFMIDRGMPTAGSALKAYVDGKGGVYTLPKEFANSSTYMTGPAVKNAETLLDRALSGESRTPATQNLRQRLSDLRPGESLTFRDYNNRLVDIRELGESAYRNLPQSEIDRIKTLGNATFNTSADVTIRYPGKGKNYEVTMNSTHTLIDRYDWNATTRDRPEDAAATTFLPVGGGEVLPVNHKDLAAMKLSGARDFTDGIVVRQRQNYVLPERSIRADAVPPMNSYQPWETGYLWQMRRGSSAPIVVTDPGEVRSNLTRAAAQNPKARITVGADEPVRPLPIVRYTPGVRSDPSRPRNPSRPGQPTE